MWHDNGTPQHLLEALRGRPLSTEGECRLEQGVGGGDVGGERVEETEARELNPAVSLQARGSSGGKREGGGKRGRGGVLGWG